MLNLFNTMNISPDAVEPSGFVTYITTGQKPKPPYHPLSDLTLVIIVGLTGAGKTTTLAGLQESGVNFTLLPNRRTITDDIMISDLQKEDGQLPYPVTDRLQRFEYTARYRRRFSGGMGHALGRLAVNPEKIKLPLIFDGLRGCNEVAYAAENFKQAYFLILDASDTTRLQRLLNRADVFDQAQTLNREIDHSLLQALSEIEGIKAVFTPTELQRICTFPQSQAISAEAIYQKTNIITTERRHYDPKATRDYLIEVLPAERICLINNDTQSIKSVVTQVHQWFKMIEN